MMVLLALVLAAVALALGRRGKASGVVGAAFRKVRERNESARQEILRVREVAEAEVVKIERERVGSLKKLSIAKRQEYAMVRKSGPKAVARWLNEFDKRVR